MWSYEEPVKIIFGNGVIKKLNEVIKENKYKNGLLVSDKYFLESGFVGEVLLDNMGCIKNTFYDIEPNPTVKNVDSCAKLIRENNIEFIVALGGGSALDCAKAASVVALTNDSITKYHGTGLQIPDKGLPLIAIPTTSGTGSEVTSVSVLTDHDLGRKAPIASKSMYPKIALVDPELTYSMPKNVTASTGIDVLCHALEGFWSKNHQPISDALALYASLLVFKYLERAFKNAYDKEAREKLSEASIIAGLAFNLPKTTASHACSFPLTNIYHIPHGEACGLTLDYFVRLNKDAEKSRLEDFARRIGFRDASHLADEIRELKKRVGLLVDLKHLSLSEEDIEDLVNESKHPNLLNNPVEVTDDVLLKMYRSLT
ncbi:iron-containing alcohol dehydrogenase family protein [Clostridium cylindrosporum]|uniref:Alcohol dehydrogenase 2 n=1 Tax=Clostridium cylindrosporum DSM 605 TaxID=1121307 RepID=A0A0J8DBY5_CLOCY|nr:iron-containing alcohol dehydrogenase family protein [Clostridium cylindrosporum]KMT21814.1 alcohol dehydrogenase 2 [Clostridium cylindrosporum DSM 605]